MTSLCDPQLLASFWAGLWGFIPVLEGAEMCTLSWAGPKPGTYAGRVEYKLALLARQATAICE